MAHNDINLWFAKDEDGNIITIDKVDLEYKGKYYCPICGSQVNAVAANGITKNGEVSKRSPHFAHFEASKCQEGMLHWWFKNKFIEAGDKFIVKADDKKEYVCKSIEVEKNYKVFDKEYKPDVTIHTECGDVIYFEMKNTNGKKIQDYLDVWISLGNTVVEVDIKDMIRSNSNGIREFKALFYNGKCFGVKKNNTYYNTIGRYKEKILSDEINEEIIKRVEKLDWFWRDLIKYKTNQIEVDNIVFLIDAIDKKDKDIVLNILKRNKCNKIIESLVDYKSKAILKRFQQVATNSILFDVSKVNISMNNSKLWKSKDKIFIKYNSIVYSTTNALICDEYEIKRIVNKVVEMVESRQKQKHEKQEFLRVIKNEKKNYKNEINNITQTIIERLRNMYPKLSFNNDEGSSETRYINKLEIGRFYNASKLPYYFYGVYWSYWNNSKEIKMTYEDDYKNNIEQIIQYIIGQIERKLFTDKAKRHEDIKKMMESMERQTQRDIKSFKNKAKRISGIFNKNKDIVTSYDIDYKLNDAYLHTLYFKDLNGNEFIVYDSEKIHHENIQLEEEGSDFKFIDSASAAMNCKAFIFKDDISENEYTYEITNSVNPSYLFSTHFDFRDKVINLSFKNMLKRQSYLKDYDFVKATKEINYLIEEIKIYLEDYVEDFYKRNDKKIIYRPRWMYSEEIDKKINEVIHPIKDICEKITSKEVNIKLNINHTKENDKFKPWVIKDFIDALQKLDIENINNIY